MLDVNVEVSVVVFSAIWIAFWMATIMKNIFDVAVYQKLIMAQVWVFKTDRVSHVWCNFKPAWLLVSNYRNFLKNWKMVP